MTAGVLPTRAEEPAAVLREQVAGRVAPAWQVRVRCRATQREMPAS